MTTARPPIRLDPDRWIDQLPPAEALAVMLDNQAEAIPALYAALPAIEVRLPLFTSACRLAGDG